MHGKSYDRSLRATWQILNLIRLIEPLECLDLQRKIVINISQNFRWWVSCLVTAYFIILSRFFVSRVSHDDLRTHCVTNVAALSVPQAIVSVEFCVLIFFKLTEMAAIDLVHVHIRTQSQITLAWELFDSQTTQHATYRVNMYLYL